LRVVGYQNSPTYQIETCRRFQAVFDIELSHRSSTTNASDRQSKPTLHVVDPEVQPKFPSNPRWTHARFSGGCGRRLVPALPRRLTVDDEELADRPSSKVRVLQTNNLVGLFRKISSVHPVHRQSDGSVQWPTTTLFPADRGRGACGLLTPIFSPRMPRRGGVPVKSHLARFSV